MSPYAQAKDDEERDPLKEQDFGYEEKQKPGRGLDLKDLDALLAKEERHRDLEDEFLNRFVEEEDALEKHLSDDEKDVDFFA